MRGASIFHGSLFRRWILANIWSEALGLAAIYYIGNFVASGLFRVNQVVPALVGVTVGLILGTLLEGILVGVAQARVMRSLNADFPRWLWSWPRRWLSGSPGPST